MKFGYSILIILFFLNTYSFCSNLTYKEVTELHNKLHITKQKPYNFSYAEYDNHMLNLGDYRVTLLDQNALTINQWNSGTFDQCLDEVCRFTNELPNTDRNFAQTVRNLKTTFEERKSNSYPPHVAIARIIAVYKNTAAEIELNSLPLPYVFLSGWTFQTANNRLPEQRKMQLSMERHVRCIGSFKKDDKTIQSILWEDGTKYPYAHSETAIGLCSLFDDNYKSSNIARQTQLGYEFIGYIIQIKTCENMCHYCKSFWGNKCYISKDAVISSTASTGRPLNIQGKVNALNVNKYNGSIYGY